MFFEQYLKPLRGKTTKQQHLQVDKCLEAVWRSPSLTYYFWFGKIH